MKKQVNFEDNLYLLLLRVKLIKDTLTLSMDPELFLNKTLEDIDFVHQTLEIALKKVQENHQRIDRETLLDHLSEIEQQFSAVLSDFLNGSGNISVEGIPALQTKLSILQKTSLRRRETVEALSAAMGKHPKEPVVSSDEFNELLKGYQ